MNVYKYSLMIMILLVIPIVYSYEVYPKNLVIQEFDYFKCSNGTTFNKYINQNIYFNTSSFTYFLNKSSSEIKKRGFNEDTDYNTRVNSDLFGDLWFRVYKDGLTYHLTTDGYWWTLYADINIENKTLGELNAIIESTKYNIKELKNIYSWVRERTLEDVENYPYQTNCYMSSTYQEKEVLLSLYDFYDYSGEINCKWDTSSIFADCSTSAFYKNVSSIIWEKKSYEEKVSYKRDRNFIFLDRTDILFDDERSFNNYGNEIILSETQFSTGFSTGQNSFVSQFGYIRELEEIPYIIEKINENSKELKQKIGILNHKVIEIRDVWLDSDSNIPNKIKKIQNITYVEARYLDKFENELKDYKDLLNRKNKLKKEHFTTFYEDYYSPMSSFYVSKLESSIKELESNIELYKQKEYNLNSYSSQITSYLVSEQSRQENERSNRQVINLTLIALLVSIGAFVLELILRSYGQEIMRWSLYSLLLLYLILHNATDLAGPIIVFLIILFEILLWTTLISLLFVDYGQLRKLSIKEKLHMMSSFNFIKTIYYQNKINTLFDVYFTSYFNMQFRLHNQARDKILQQINKVLEDSENILNFAQSRSRFSKKEKNKLIKNFEHIKEKGGLCKEGILYALSADKILDSDKRKFQSYQKKLNNINETSINEFLYNRSSKRLLLREGDPIQIR